ncbi:ATP dependent DNA ligase [Amycolatopsis magusensis]|uniref:ATP dependent DNA ligase n=1 Tax=Amycolatopsis magusensis TaxID=882444 RepID=UPI0037B12524
MQPKPGRLPPVAEDEEWAYEFDWGGPRTLVRVQDGRTTVRERSGRAITAEYPELQGIGASLGNTEVLLDGQLMAFESGLPNPAALKRRGKRRAAVWYLPSDVLHLDGTPCLGLPYLQRRQLLADLDLRGHAWQTPEHQLGNGGAALRSAIGRGLPGVLAKRAKSQYQPGKRSPHWIAVTGTGVQEVVIGGWRPGGGSRSGTFGSLLLGIPHGSGLRYVGNVGTGFTHRALEVLAARLNRLERKTSPFHSVPDPQARGAHWVRPCLVGEVVFRGWTDAACLRTPRWRGLLPGRDPGEVRIGE